MEMDLLQKQQQQMVLHRLPMKMVNQLQMELQIKPHHQDYY